MSAAARCASRPRRATSTARRRTTRHEPGPARRRRRPTWTATTKMNFEGAPSTTRPGIVVYGDDDNFTKFGRIARTPRSARREVRVHPRERGRAAQRRGADSTANIAGGLPGRLLGAARYDGTNVTGQYSTGRDERGPDVGRACAAPGGRQIGVFSFGNTATDAAPVAAFDSFRSTVRRSERAELRRRVRRREPRQGSLERDRPRHAGRVRGGRWRVHDHHVAGRHLHR